MINDYVGQD